MGFLGLNNKSFAVFGVSNRKSVGVHIGNVLESEGANVLYVVHTEERRQELQKLKPHASIFVCDVKHTNNIQKVVQEIGNRYSELHGFVHSIAYANYSEGFKPFHEVPRQDFLEAMQISCHSLIEVSHELKGLLHKQASVVTISISTTSLAAENYGYMAPVKAALNSTLVFLAKSFSSFSEVRFNGVGASLLKTNSSAGIPGYVDSYLFAEKIIPRKRGLQTEEVANVAAFLLSPRSSGINAQNVIVDAAMGINFFDADIIRASLKENL